MQIIKISKNGTNYLSKVLLDKPKTITRSLFWRIAHNSGREDVSLKIGRYNKKGFREEELETENPKSELTLTTLELENLVSFLKENYEPFKEGAQKYISVGDDFNEDSAKKFTAFFKTKNKEKLFKLILKENLIEEDLLRSVEIKNRQLAINRFDERLLNPNLLEDRGVDNWQKWFQENSWVLGSDIVEVLGERKIDTQNIVDYLTKSPDGYLDIIEIKRPQNGKMDFWATNKDHNNWIPSTELIKAITQASNYIYEVETESNSKKFEKRIGCGVVKPRCTLIFGRSNDWDQEKYESFRILNSSYHNLTIMTYDQVLERAKRILQKLTEK